MRLAVLAVLLAAPLAACTSVPAAQHPMAALYDPSTNAQADFAKARERSAASGRPLLAVLGANWCHDSQALAGWLDTPRFRDLVAENFELVFIDVGRPQAREGRNLDIARGFGIDDLASTPALLIVAPDGTLLNRDSATGWGNAASRSENAIYREIARYAQRSHDG